jgi:hypothetical protein
MARIRSIKPEFWTSESIASLSRDARLLFVGLWNHVDDEGRCKDNPRLIKAAVFPLDDDVTSDTVDGLLDELSSKGRCVFYEVSGQRYLQVVGWHHQKIDRKRDSEYPAQADGRRTRCKTPDQKAFDEVSTIERRDFDESSSPDLGILGSGSRDQGSIAPPSSPPKQRARDLVFDAVTEVCGIDMDSLTATARGPLVRAVKELKTVGATADEVRVRAIEYRVRMPEMSLTPMALVKHWPSLAEPRRQVSRGNATLARLQANGSKRAVDVREVRS